MHTTRVTVTAVIFSGLIFFLGACASTQVGSALSSAEATAQSNLLYELRTYTTHPGKLEELHSRFSNHTQALFEKHGIKNVAYWTPVDTPNTLVYIIAHTSKEAAEASWKAFVADEEWRTVYAESQANGPLVANIESVFMTTTDYSPRF